MALAIEFILCFLIIFEKSCCVKSLAFSHVSNRYSTPENGVHEVDDSFLSRFDLSAWSKATASSTCGESGREEFCYLADTGSNKGHRCEYCDSQSLNESHPVQNILDGTERFWKSKNAEQLVTIDIDLGREFYVWYLAIKMGPSPKPADWVLERSVDFGANYRVWQFFAEYRADCIRLFGVTPDVPLRTPDQVLCQPDAEQLLEKDEDKWLEKDDEIFVMLIKGRPVHANFTRNPKLQDWSRATNVRLRFLRLQTHRGEMMHTDRSLSRRHFYSIRSVEIGGRCVCHGHEESCIVDQILNEMRCVCTGNTCGPSCSECCPIFRQRPWKETAACEACNCFGHADECVYNETVANLNLSVDITGNYVGGGVCIDCRHPTEGINCERCRRGFYRVLGKEVNDIQSCQTCECNPFGSVVADECEPIEGQCRCYDFVVGRRCNRCIPTYWDFPNCKPCNCFTSGSSASNCHPKTGQCHCLEHVSGLKCDTCLRPQTQIWTANGCLNCDACGVSLVNETKALSANASLVSHWTEVMRQDLASSPNLVERRLDSFRWRSALARNLTARMPIADLKSMHYASVLSHMNMVLISMPSLWNDVQFIWVTYRSKAATEDTKKIMTDVTRMTFDVNSVCFRMKDKSRMLKGLRQIPCEIECQTFMKEGFLQITGTLANKISEVKVRSYVEREQAIKLRSFVYRFFWNLRRVSVAVSRLKALSDSASVKSRLTKKANKLNFPVLEKLQTKMIKLRRRVKQLPQLKGLILTSLKTDLKRNFASLKALNRRLDAINYKVLGEWSTVPALKENFNKHLMPHVNSLTNQQTKISAIAQPLRLEFLVRERLSDNLTAIARLMTEARDTLDFLVPLHNKSEYEARESSGYPDTDDEQLEFDDDENYAVNKLDGHGLNGLPNLVVITELTQMGLDLERQNLFMSDKVETASKKFSDARKKIDNLETINNLTATTLKVIAGLSFPLLINREDTMGFIRIDDVANVLRKANDELPKIRKVCAGLEAAISGNQRELSKTERIVLNVTTKVDSIQRLLKRSAKSWDHMSSFKTKFEDVKKVVRKWHKSASRYQMAVSLNGSNLILPVDEVMFNRSVTTIIEMAFRSTQRNSFLMMLGEDFVKPRTCRILAYLEDSVLTLSLRREEQTVNVQHPLPVQPNTWYHLSIHWILDRVNLTLMELRTKNLTAVTIGGVFPTGILPRRYFHPATIFLGRPPGNELSAIRKLQSFNGCVDSLKVNGRLIGLISQSVTPCLSPPILPRDRLDILSFDGHDVLCVHVPSNSSLIVEFRLRTLQRNSVVTFMNFHSNVWLAVVIKNGELMVEMANYVNKLSRTSKKEQLTIPSGLLCNDGQPHLVELTVVGNALHLNVDSFYRNRQIILQFGTLIVTEVYLGGLPTDILDEQAPSVLCSVANFHGCITGFKLANSPPIATSAMPSVSVSCPKSFGFDCLCTNERPIRLKKLDFVIGNLSVAFALQFKPVSAANRTVLHYTTSPHSGFEVKVKGNSPSPLMTVRFWSREGGRHVGGDWRPLIDATWHFIMMYTNQNGSVVTVDENVYVATGHGFVQHRLYPSQHRLILGPERVTAGIEHSIIEQPVCYKDLIINEASVDPSVFLDLSSGATTCPATL